MIREKALLWKANTAAYIVMDGTKTENMSNDSTLNIFTCLCHSLEHFIGTGDFQCAVLLCVHKR